jgi:hypothetical protein
MMWGGHEKPANRESKELKVRVSRPKNSNSAGTEKKEHMVTGTVCKDRTGPAMKQAQL